MVAFTLFSTDDPVSERLIGRWGSAAGRSHARARGAERERRARLARAALRALLAQAHPGQEWDFDADERGKLFATARFGAPGPGVSVSYSGEWVACAIGYAPVGIDIERHKRRSYSAIAEYAFGARENEMVRADGNDAFYRIWTLREAIAKATGDGLALVADRRDRAHAGPPEGRWIASADSGALLLAYMRPQPGISLAIALLAGQGTDWGAESFDRLTLVDLL